MKENELITLKEARNNLIEREDVFDDARVKALSSFLLPKDFGATTQMVADYFEVDTKTIEKVAERNEDELSQNGLKIETKENLLTYNMSVKTKRGGFDVLDENDNILFSGSNKGVRIFTRRTILNVAMLLRDSEVAKQIRTVLLDATENTNVIKEIIKDNQEELKELLFAVYNGGQDAVIASKKITEIEVAKATKPLLEKIENDKEFVDFAITVGESSDCITMNEMAKLIQKEGIKIGRNKLFALLRDEKILMSDNQPYQKYLNCGYFEVIETVKKTPFGDKTFRQTVVTGKGQVFIVQFVKNKLKESINK